MDGRHGRLSADYVQAVLSLANRGVDEAPAELHGRLAPDYAGVDVSPPPAVARADGVHGRLTRGYVQAVAEFLASA
jgi:hypothetical protein